MFYAFLFFCFELDKGLTKNRRNSLILKELQGGGGGWPLSH